MLYIVNISIHDCKHKCASSMPSVPSKKKIIYNLLQNLNSHVLTDKCVTDPIFIKHDVICVLWCQKINNSIITLRCVMNMFPINMIRQWASDFNSRRMFFVVVVVVNNVELNFYAMLKMYLQFSFWSGQHRLRRLMQSTSPVVGKLYWRTTFLSDGVESPSLLCKWAWSALGWVSTTRYTIYDLSIPFFLPYIR